MRTVSETVGFGGGFTDAKALRPVGRAGRMVQARGAERPRMDAVEDARPELQLRAGASNCREQMTDDSIAPIGREGRWKSYAIASLVMTGIAPAVLCAVLIMACEAVGWWLAIPSLAAIGLAFWRVTKL